MVALLAVARAAAVANRLALLVVQHHTAAAAQHHLARLELLAARTHLRLNSPRGHRGGSRFALDSHHSGWDVRRGPALRSGRLAVNVATARVAPTQPLAIVASIDTRARDARPVVAAVAIARAAAVANPSHHSGSRAPLCSACPAAGHSRSSSPPPPPPNPPSTSGSRWPPAAASATASRLKLSRLTIARVPAGHPPAWPAWSPGASAPAAPTPPALAWPLCPRGRISGPGGLRPRRAAAAHRRTGRAAPGRPSCPSASAAATNPQIAPDPPGARLPGRRTAPSRAASRQSRRSCRAAPPGSPACRTDARWRGGDTLIRRSRRIPASTPGRTPCTAHGRRCRAARTGWSWARPTADDPLHPPSADQRGKRHVSARRLDRKLVHAPGARAARDRAERALGRLRLHLRPNTLWPAVVGDVGRRRDARASHLGVVLDLCHVGGIGRLSGSVLLNRRLQAARLLRVGAQQAHRSRRTLLRRRAQRGLDLAGELFGLLGSSRLRGALEFGRLASGERATQLVRLRRGRPVHGQKPLDPQLVLRMRRLRPFLPSGAVGVTASERVRDLSH
eukprot:scaffold21802_cov132-Isochrysis_galbana.AAC.2